MDKKNFFIIVSSIIFVFSILIVGIILGMKNSQIYVTFSSPLNNNIQTVKLNKGSTIDFNNYNETVEGYEFIGWYTSNTLEHKLNKNYIFTTNKTIYAGYSKIINIKEINNLKFTGIYSYTVVSDGIEKIDSSHIKKLLDLGVKRLDLSNCSFKGNIINSKTFNNFNLKEVILGKSNTIDSQAFYNCFELESVICPDGLLFIKSKAFENCYNLKNIQFKYGLLELEENSIYGSDQLKEINLPSTVDNISPNFISNCKNLKNINVSTENNKYTSENGILYSKDKSKIIKFPEKKEIDYILPIEVVEILDYAFYKSNIKSIEFNNNIKTIGNFSFYGCNNLKNIEFKDNNSYSLGNSVFENCENLKNVKFNIGLNIIGDSVFKNDKNLETVEILNSTNINYDKLTTIGNNLFYGCEKLKSFEIPSSVTTIGNNMFYECKLLESVLIAGNIK